MEKIKKKRKLRVPVKKIILATIAIAVVAPNALQAIGYFSGNKKYKKYDQKYYVNSVVGGLLKKDLIKLEIKNGKKYIRLTKKGEQELARLELNDFKIKKPKKWDKKWRIVIFDIKETRKGTRTILRSTLSRLGFVKLQNSVWVFPYDCKELIVMMKSSLFLGKDVLYMTVEKIENDKWLKEVFGLK